jgi:glycosyltransferase involved in cell wall biosynthesis
MTPQCAIRDQRLGAFVVTSDRPQELKNTLKLLLSQTQSPEHILVVDNRPSSQSHAVVSMFPSTSVVYHAMPENVGPAGAAAYALDRLSRLGFDWIYWGDDDDPPRSTDVIERVMTMATSADRDTGAVAAGGAMWDWKRGEVRRLPDEALTGPLSVDVIAGGQHLILRREIVSTVGLPDARLFFGFEELEYCLRIKAAGYRLLAHSDLMRESRRRFRRLGRMPRRARIPQTPANRLWRQYYSTRNYIFGMRHSFGRPDLARRECVKALARTCLAWARGLEYGAAFTRLQMRGVWDGYRGHMGRTVVPKHKYTDEMVAASAE